MTRWHLLFALESAHRRARGTGHHHCPTTRRDAVAGRGASTARANSPTYRQTLNDAGPAQWGVRNAYGALLPQVNARPAWAIPDRAESNFGGGRSRRPRRSYNSGYSLGPPDADQRPDSHGAGPGRRRSQRATDEDISGAGVALERRSPPSTCTTLQADAQVGVARQQVLRQRRLPQARQGALPGGPGDAAGRAAGGGDEGHVASDAAARGPDGERGEARPAPAHGRGAAGGDRPDRAHRFVSR